MLSIDNILETNQMIHDNKLDVRTITMGISLLECASSSGKELCDRIYDRITKEAEHLVRTGEDIEREFGVPIINKRISVTPISLVAGGSDLTSYVPIAEALDRAAKTVGVNFIGGFSALVQHGGCSGCSHYDTVLSAFQSIRMAGYASALDCSGNVRRSDDDVLYKTIYGGTAERPSGGSNH